MILTDLSQSYIHRIVKPTSTLPTPRITPKVRTQVSEVIDVSSKRDIPNRQPLTPPLQIGSASTSRNNSSQILQPIVGSVTSSSEKDSSTSNKGIKRPASALVLTDPASLKRSKIKNVTFNSNLEQETEEVEEAQTIEKNLHRFPTEILAPDSDGIPTSITKNTLRQFENGREILAGLDPHSDTSSSSGDDDDEILKKHLEGLSGSAIRKLLAKASDIPLEDLMDTEELGEIDNSNIEADLLEAVKENIEGKKFVGRKDVEKEVRLIFALSLEHYYSDRYYSQLEYEDYLPHPVINRAPPRLNLIRPTPRTEISGSAKKLAQKQKNYLSASQSQQKKNRNSQIEKYATEQVQRKSGFSSDDQELANILGAISSVS